MNQNQEFQNHQFMDNLERIVSLSGVGIAIKEREILRQVTFDISQGEFLYLLGNSGTGKSTLMKLLFGLLPLQQGSAQVAGFDLKTLTPQTIHRYRRKVGMIFQDFKLFSDWTVEDNLNFVLQATDWKDEVARKEKITVSLDSVQMEEARHQKIYELSGGQQQKLAIARALLNEPILLLADEPTGNLDPANAEMIINLLHSVSSNTNTAILLTTHHHNLVDKFPARTLLCDHKLIKEL